jgi:hypothetical protein
MPVVPARRRQCAGADPARAKTRADHARRAKTKPQEPICRPARSLPDRSDGRDPRKLRPKRNTRPLIFIRRPIRRSERRSSRRSLAGEASSLASGQLDATLGSTSWSSSGVSASLQASDEDSCPLIRFRDDRHRRPLSDRRASQRESAVGKPGGNAGWQGLLSTPHRSVLRSASPQARWIQRRAAAFGSGPLDCVPPTGGRTVILAGGARVRSHSDDRRS